MATPNSAISNKEETLWMTNISKAMEWRKIYSQEDLWTRVDNSYAHQYSGDIPRFNLTFMLAQTLIPNLVYQSPGVINVGDRPGLSAWTSFWDSIDNWWIEKSELKHVLQEAVLDCYLHNMSVGFIGYDFGEGLDRVSDQPNRTRLQGSAWIDLVPAHRVLFSPGTTKLRNCPWVAKFVSTPISRMKGPRLRNKVSSSLPSEIHNQETQLWKNRTKEDYIFYWQIHRAEDQKWCWLSTNGKYILPWEEDPYQVSGLPCEALVFNKNTHSIWGTSDPIYIRSQHKEGDDVRYQAMKQRRLSVSKFLYNSTALDEDDVDKLVSTDTPGAIAINMPTDKSIRDVVYEFTGGTNFALFQQVTRQVLHDAQLVTGMGHNQMGMYSPGKRSATEASIVENINTSRMGLRRALVADFAEGLINRANKLFSNNWGQDTLQQVIGAEGALYWVQATSKDLQSSSLGLTTKVNIESLAPVSRERRKQEASQLLAQLGAMTQSGVNPMPIIAQLLSQFEWVDVRQILPQYDETIGMQQFIQQQQQVIQQGQAGPQAVNNLQGINSLLNRLPQEIDTGEEDYDIPETPAGAPGTGQDNYL